MKGIMPEPGRRIPRRYPGSIRRRVDVALARAWEALIDAHTRHALRFISLLSRRIPFDEALIRYVREMGVPASMAGAIQTRVLSELETADYRRLLEESVPVDVWDGAEERAGNDLWRRLRPDRVVRGVRERYRRNESTERWVQLAIAQAEEGVIRTHIENATAFATVLEPHVWLGRAVEDYIYAMGLAGGRAQAVFQRAMARLADARIAELESERASPSTGKHS
jgi:hypothetical protein